MAAKELWTGSLNSKKDLRLFSKEELHSHMETLAIREREHQADVVAGVSEVARRKLYYDYGFTSLFDYMTKGRGFPNSSAQRYIDAARLCAVVPTLREDIANGEVNLSQVTVVAKTLRQKEREEPNFKMEVDQATALFDRIKGEDVKSSQQIVAQELKIEVRQQEIARAQADGSVRLEITLSKEQEAMLQRVKELISHTHPSPSFAEVFEHLAQEFLKKKDPLVAQGRSGQKTGIRTGKNVVNETAKETTKETAKETAERAIAQTAGKSAERAAGHSWVTEIITEKSTHRNTDTTTAESASEETMGQKASAHINDQGSDSVHKSGAEAAEARGNEISENHFNLELKLDHAQQERQLLQEERPPLGPDQASTVQNVPPSPSDRTYIPVRTVRFVFRRDQSCRHQDEITGEACGSRFQLQIDHIWPLWARGSNEPENLQLLCSIHNRLKYRKETGISWG